MNFPLRKDANYLMLLLAMCVFLFGSNLGSFGLMDPDEPFYTLTAKEMLQRGDISTPVIFGHPQFEKPAFFYWVLYLSFKWFGVHEWSARIGPCLAGILIVLITYLWARVLFRRPEVAFVCGAILATAAEFVVMSRIVLTDIFLCLFVSAALYCFSLGYFNSCWRKPAWRLLFFFCGLGFLTKGLLGVLLPFMAIGLYLLVQGELALFSQFPWVSGGFLFAAAGLPWYALMTAQQGTGFLTRFFMHENIRRFFVAEHQRFDRSFFYPGGVLGGFFPWTFVLPAAIVYALGRARKPASRYGRQFLWLSVCLVSFFLFFMTAKSKLLSYIFPVFPVIALMIGKWGYLLHRAARRGAVPFRGLSWAAVLILGIFPVVLCVGVHFYGIKEKIDLLKPVVLFALTVIPLSWTGLVFWWRNKIKQAFFLVLASTAAFSWVAFGYLLPAADVSFASRKMVKTSQKFIPADHGLFVGSKILVRGVSYYSGNQKMAVLTDDAKGTFYTKHSIPMITCKEDLMNIQSSLFPVFFFLQPKQYKILRNIATDDFKITVLDQTPQRILARLDRVG